MNVAAAIHRDTQTVIWFAPWSELPRMLPLSVEIHVRKLPLIPPELRQRVDEMVVRIDWERLSYHECPPPGRELVDHLGLLAFKCRAAWNLLTMLHEMQRSAQGPLPGVHWNGSSPEDMSLASQEMDLATRTAQLYVDRFYNRIWTAPTIDTIRQIGLEATMMTKAASVYS